MTGWDDLPEVVREQLISLGNTAIIVTDEFVKVVPAGPANCKNSFRQTSGGELIGGQWPECEGLNVESRIKIQCVCGKVGLVERKYIGKTITCPKCEIARIKIVDPEASLPNDDESRTIDIVDESPTKKKIDIPPVPLIAQGKLWAIGRHWRLTAILCLVAIIAGIMVYNQYDGWRREKNAREAFQKARILAEEAEQRAIEAEKQTREIDEALAVKDHRHDIDVNPDQHCVPSKITVVSAEDFLAFVTEQPDETEFRSSFLCESHYRRDDIDDFLKGNIGDPATFVKTMKNSGDLLLRWALVKGGVTEKEIAEADWIVSGWSTIRFTRSDSTTIRAFRFKVDISELFPIEDWWWSTDGTLETFGSCRKSNFLSDHIEDWKQEHLAEN